MTITNQSRAFQAYCVGQAKSGTASMYGLFQANFRSAHEPERSELLKKILLETNGSISHDEFVEYICDRDKRLWLEFDSSWVNYFIKKEEQSLKEIGLFSLECYLNCWRSHVIKSSQIIPPERLLIIRTHEIQNSLDNVAQFLHVPYELLDDAKCHLNKGTMEKRIVSLVDKAFLEDTVAHVCNDMMHRYFPGIKSIDEAYSLYGNREAYSTH
jgi:hypothetical protein